jgi:hypothetical protein
MAWRKGQSGNPQGLARGKPFRDALRMEIAAAGDDLKELRKIARALLTKAGAGDIAAIKEVADRLDGKPAQDSALTIDDKRDATEWTTAELIEFLVRLLPGVKEKKSKGPW